MAQQRKRRIDPKEKATRPTLSYLIGPGTPESEKQRVHSAPGEKQPAPQAAHPSASEPATPANALNADEQPTPPRLQAIPKEPPVAASPPNQKRQTAASREPWKPPSTQETVGKFLSDIAEIAPPPAQERQESMPPAFLPLPRVSSETASRKKANTTPFLSEIQSATPSTGKRLKRPRKRSRSLRRRRAIWAAAIAGILALIVLAALLAFVLLRR